MKRSFFTFGISVFQSRLLSGLLHSGFPRVNDDDLILDILSYVLAILLASWLSYTIYDKFSFSSQASSVIGLSSVRCFAFEQ